MTAGDWISLGSVLLACTALAVSALAYKLQQGSQASSDLTYFGDLIEKIRECLASLTASDNTGPEGDAASAEKAVAGLQGFALEARRLTQSASIEPNWHDSVTLAYAFSEVWDTGIAFEYWDRAVDLARTHHQSRVRVLTWRGQAYYVRGRPGDWDLGRRDFEMALSLLDADPENQGPDITGAQVVNIYLFQAGQEFMTGHEILGVALVGRAFDRSASISVPWRQKRAEIDVGNFALSQDFVPLEHLNLPEEFVQRISAVLQSSNLPPS